MEPARTVGGGVSRGGQHHAGVADGTLDSQVGEVCSAIMIYGGLGLRRSIAALLIAWQAENIYTDDDGKGVPDGDLE